MRRFSDVRFFIKLAIICGLAILLSLYPGTVNLEWNGYTTSLPLSLFLAILFSFFVILFLIYKFYCWVCNIPYKANFYLKKKQEKKIDDLILDGLIAISAKQVDEAQVCASKAAALDSNHPLVLFLMGQASFMNNDLFTAQKTFFKMSEVPSLRFLGLRGLALLAAEHNDQKQLESCLEQMYEIRSKSPWVLKQLEQISFKKNLEDLSPSPPSLLPFYQHLSKKEAETFQGLMIWVKLTKNQKVNLTILERLTLLETAAKLLPSNPVIISAYSKLLNQQYEKTKAIRILKKAYRLSPHRYLAETLLDISAPKTSLLAYKIIEKLTATHPNHEESYWIMANAAIKADLIGQARYQLTPLLISSPTRSVCELMSKIEDDQQNKLWAEQACKNFIEWQWCCSKCLNVTPIFEVMCQKCEEIGTIQWKKSSIESLDLLQKKYLSNDTNFV